ncbi:MAG: glycosyltransferase family 2 protein [Paludibacteraceae bacterium]|nr:glycosyltransferase family 2 protein [Paludibacteraceae bacterium]
MMKNSLSFSILIANYNNGKYLMDAIESVRQQTYTNWEIILVDDCSTDNSHELYKEFEKDERIHIFLNNQNRGCGYTKNRCVAEAQGEIL